MEISFVQAKHFTPANRKYPDITLIAIHSAECGESTKAAENLQAWTAGPDASNASWHYAVDSNSITQSVEEKDVAWHAGPVNGYSIGIEHAGYAKQTPAEWADDFSKKTLERSAELVADICLRYQIPPQRITAADLKAGKKIGICGHVDVTMGLTGGKGHTDPGESFPWDAYLALVRSYMEEEPETIITPPMMTPEEDRTGRLDQLVEVVLDGVTWLVSPLVYGPLAIGDAKKLIVAMGNGFELPTPALVDAIWRQADLRVNPGVMVQTHDGVHMATDALIEKTRQGLIEAIGNRALGEDYELLAGAFKDIIEVDGKLGLYGWHVENEKDFATVLKMRLKASLPLHAPVTPGIGKVIQQPFFGHALSWKDYSQYARPCRRA